MPIKSFLYKLSYLQIVYLALCIFASLAAIQGIFFPRWPKIYPINMQAIKIALEKQGFNPKILSELPAKRRSEFARSEFKLLQLDHDLKLSLATYNVRQRLNFNLVYMTKELESNSFKNVTFHSDSFPFRSGNIDNHFVIQSCFVLGESYGATDDQLTRIIDNSKHTESNVFRRILALEPIRNYRCTLVTIYGDTHSTLLPDIYKKIFSAIQQS